MQLLMRSLGFIFGCSTIGAHKQKRKNADLSQLLEECVFAELDNDDERALIVAKMVPIARLLAIHFSEPSSRSDLEGDLTFARSNMSERKQALVELRRFRPDDGV